MISNFEYYKVFYYVAKYGNLTRAAGVLCTSQPAITRTIHNLENELGCRLFTRSKKGVELTPEGQRFFDYVSAGCAQFFKGESELSSMLGLDSGTIYISATETALHCFLFQAMEEFNKQYENVKFNVLNNSTKESIAALKEGKVDMAVVSAPFHISKPLKRMKVSEYHNILIAGNRFRHLQGKVLTLKELSRYPWISLTADSITRQFLNDFFEERGLYFSPDVELATTDMILPSVRHNLGLGFIPEPFASAEMKAGEVFEIKLNEKFTETDITLVYDAEYPRSIASKAFQEFVTVQKKKH